ncbi:MAG: hypothetical protein A2887_04740 [Alphaproteobacteria bacterium RIFCSPLOWO2_01_FULL_40_26]|nr:MAG: hypothetical protein A2887_04740 [Alphaproteobacteria bacterium RIFCSPLOWO2_01_FULL_40_26]OFX09484.1 MAG: hypothetical protein A3H30_02215 [Alphaproteobacteria bacterium RIFCSPLOWO2_02_FULL_40_19]OFX11116.1 MAG: hypothetical protein A3G22_02775 [Alphaproteobacteria bacterium RIFCSPLOWO2_12_FULL_40_11]
MHNENHKLPLFKLLLLSLALFLIATQIWHSFNSPLWTDDAFFGTVAKNLASGNGYSSSDTRWNSAFSSYITAGPVIILPAALMIKIFGNQHWVLGLTITMLIWILLTMIFVAWRSDKKFPALFLALLLCLLFSINSANYGIYNNSYLSLWYLMLGEMPSIFLTILGAMILFSQESRKKMIGGGLVLGLAIMCKNLSAIACTIILLTNSIKIIFGQKNLREKILLIMLSGIGFVVPFLTFELVKIIFLGLDYYFEAQLQNLWFHQVAGASKDPRPVEKIYQAFTVFAYSIILLVISAALLIFQARNHAKKNANAKTYYWLGIALIASFVFHALWWIFFSVFINYRYLIAALFYCIFGISFLICCTDSISKTLKILISLIVLFRFPSLIYMASHAFDKSSKLQEQLQITEEIVKLQKQGIAMVSCGLNFELEYLLPGSGNFMDCRNLPKNLINKNFMLVNDFVIPNKVLMEGTKSTEIRELPDEIMLRCNKKHLATATYLLSWCVK